MPRMKHKPEEIVAKLRQVEPAPVSTGHLGIGREA